MSSDMEEKATFGQAVAAVTAASSVLKLTYASAGMRLFSNNMNLSGENIQKE